MKVVDCLTSILFLVFFYNVILYPFQINSLTLQKMILLQLKKGNNWRTVWICSYKQDEKNWCKEKDLCELKYR